jgi:hypothetical protein
MNNSASTLCGLRLARSPNPRTTAAVIAAAAVALLAAACSIGSPSPVGSDGAPTPGGSTSSPSAIAYSACMRSHGVPGFPDPGSDGAIPKGDAQHFGVSPSQLQAAQSACQPLLPVGGSFDQQTELCMATGNCPPALVQQILTAERGLAQCMRSHGLLNFPDPTLDSQGRPVFVWSISRTGIDPHSSQYEAVDTECGRVTGGAPEPRAVSP